MLSLNVAQKFALLLLFEKKLQKVNNRPRNKKSPNLVTLTLISSYVEKS
jgi:hypothetical protein